MTEEEKQLLLIDLCPRLPYEVNVLVSSSHTTDPVRKKLNANLLFGLQKSVLTIKPYLRPMSSMTKEEKKEYTSYVFEQPFLQKDKIPNMGSVPMCIDWLLIHHFDFRGLIEKGLALEAKEDMYKI